MTNPALIYVAEILAQTGNATSTTSHNVTTGSKTFTITGSLDTAVGEPIAIKQTSVPANTLYGTITGISGSDYTVNVTSVDGSGSSITDWTLIGKKTLKVASPPRGYNHPDAGGVYEPRLVQAALFQRHIVARGSTLGGTDIAFGNMVIDNTEADFDEWLTYGYGDTATVYIGERTTAYGSLTTVLTGKIEQPNVSNRNQLTFRLKDRQIELDSPAQPTSYDGSNSGTSGIEGTPDDLQGKPKVRVFGIVKNLDADHVNTSQQIFATNHDKDGNTAAVNSIDAVRVNGSAWTAGTDRANLAALQAATPAQGVYDTCLAEGLFKMGGTIGQGLVTCDVTESGTASENHTASIMNRLLLDVGIDSSDITSADITALESAAGWDSGVVVRGQSYKQLLDYLAAGAHAWYAPNRLGVYNIKQIAAPAGSPAATFRPFIFGNKAGADDYEIQDIQRIVSKDPGRGVPAWKVIVNYQPMWAVQSKDSLAAAVTESNKEKFSREYRSVVAEDETVLYQFPEAIELEVDVPLIDEADAQDLADLILALMKVRKDVFSMVATYDADIAAAIDLGDVIDVFYDRFGLDNGELYNIHGIKYNARERMIELELWG